MPSAKQARRAKRVKRDKPVHGKYHDSVCARSARLRSFLDKCDARGIATRGDWTCCMSCGHANLERVANYIFFHRQGSCGVRQGGRQLCLYHKITGDMVKAVRELTKDYGVDWDGSENTAMVFPLENPYYSATDEEEE